MPHLRHFFEKLDKYIHFFASELVLLLLLILAVGNNVTLKANADTGHQGHNRSLFFVYLQSHKTLNPNLVDASESISQKLAGEPNLLKQILSASVMAKTGSAFSSEAAPLPTLSGSALMKPNPADSGGIPKKDIEVYEVRPGDTVARIAAAYGVNNYTIIHENGLSAAGMIRPGQELRILPTTGIKHTIKDGETLESIAKKYNVHTEDILEYNEIEIPEFIQIGDEVIIPNGVAKTPPTPQRQQYLADLQREDVKRAEVPDSLQGGGEYIWPLTAAHRLSQGFKRSHPGIDVPCRDCEVVAAAGGIVELSGYQKGYGNTIVINHGSGHKTRYGHASNLLVSAGDRVEQGQTIMISGNTGRSTGPHLHFEIIESGTRINPLSRVK